jgi:hypothetical protein
MVTTTTPFGKSVDVCWLPAPEHLQIFLVPELRSFDFIFWGFVFYLFDFWSLLFVRRFAKV